MFYVLELLLDLYSLFVSFFKDIFCRDFKLFAGLQWLRCLKCHMLRWEGTHHPKINTESFKILVSRSDIRA